MKTAIHSHEAWFRGVSFTVWTSDLFFHHRFRSDFSLGDGRQVDDKTEWGSKTYARARYSSSRLQSQGNSRLFTSTRLRRNPWAGHYRGRKTRFRSRGEDGVIRGASTFELAIIRGLPCQDNSRSRNPRGYLLDIRVISQRISSFR